MYKKNKRHGLLKINNLNLRLKIYFFMKSQILSIQEPSIYRSLLQISEPGQLC